MDNKYMIMRFQITGFRDDPEFERLEYDLAKAKTELISYFNDMEYLDLIPSEDRSILRLDDSAVEDSQEYLRLVSAFDTAKKNFVRYLNKNIAFHLSTRFSSKASDDNCIGNKIAEYRQKVGMSQQELADKAKITRPYLSLIENGKQEVIGSDVMFRIADALNVPYYEIFFR